MSKALKVQREDLGKDLNDIALVTRIKSAYLRAIEDEEYEKLPVEVYTRGYIREYAEFLGVPAAEALEPYEEYLKDKGVRKDRDPFVDKSLASRLAKEQSEEEAALERQQILDEVLAGKVGAGEQMARNRVLPRIVWIILPILAAIGLYAYISQEINAPLLPPPEIQQPEPPPPPVAQEPQPPLPEQQQDTALQEQPPASPEGMQQQPGAPSTPQQPLQKPAPAPEEKSAAQKEKEKAAPKKKPQALDIVATEQTWVEVSVDGGDKKEVLLRPGDKVSYTANESIGLLIGNAAGVKLTFNGKVRENLGASGEVVRLTLP